jgi:uncharacterized membrane protein
MTQKIINWLVILVILAGLMYIASLLTNPQTGMQLQGFGWLLWVAIGAVLIFIIYFATAESKIWIVGTREVVYMAIGAALYGLFSYIFNGTVFVVPSVSLVAIRPAISIPIFFGFVFGPVVGFFTGAVGNILGDFITGWGVFPVWDLGNGFIGLVAGLVLLFADKKRSLDALTVAVAVLALLATAMVFVSPNVTDPFSGQPKDFSGFWWVPLLGGILVVAGRYLLASNIDLAAAEVWGGLGIILGIGFAAIADIWVNGYSLGTALVGEFVPAAGPNLINAAILVPILLVAYYAVQQRTGR